MEKKKVHAGIRRLAVLLSALALTGCMSLADTLINSSAAVSTGKARSNQAVADAAGLGALQDGMVASLVYAQVFFAGGYAQGYENFKEGEGVVWRLTVRDENGTETMQVERALLRRDKAGNTWWLLRYAAEGEDELVSEALLDQDYNIIKFRYRDPETASIREWIPEEAEPEQKSAAKTKDKSGAEDSSKSKAKSKSKDSAETEEEIAGPSGQQGYFRGDYSQHVVGKGPVTVPAGRFNAEHVLIEDVYVEEESGSSTESREYKITYEWWLAPQVPGNMVQYSWKNETEGSSLTGQLISHRKGYTTQLNSF